MTRDQPRPQLTDFSKTFDISKYNNINQSACLYPAILMIYPNHSSYWNRPSHPMTYNWSINVASIWGTNSLARDWLTAHQDTITSRVSTWWQTNSESLSVRSVSKKMTKKEFLTLVIRRLAKELNKMDDETGSEANVETRILTTRQVDKLKTIGKYKVL